jgi:dTDP-4-dehydrorhamnose reductase
MKILLFGANGQLGTELRRTLAPLGDVIATTRTGLLPDGAPCFAADFDVPEALPGLIDQVAPDVVVNAAAYTAVDRAESDPAAAFRANAHAPAHIAGACAARDALLVHYSTDYVFDGSAARPYREEDPVNPLGVYGASKLAGEDAIRSSGARHMIFRTAWVYAAHSHNFLRTMLRLAAERNELRVVSDQIGAPTPARCIADVTACALRQPLAKSGLWHLAASGHTSWHEFAEAIFEGACARALIARAPRVIPITTLDYPTPAQRPAWSVLDTTRLQRDFRIQPIAWQDGLGSVLDEMSGSQGSAM